MLAVLREFLDRQKTANVAFFVGSEFGGLVAAAFGREAGEVCGEASEACEAGWVSGEAGVIKKSGEVVDEAGENVAVAGKTCVASRLGEFCGEAGETSEFCGLAKTASLTPQTHIFSCFYAFYAECFGLVFASKKDSFHAKVFDSFFAANKPFFASVSVYDDKSVTQIQGVQANGFVRAATAQERKCYFEKFPFARAFGGKIYTFEAQNIKFTNNKFGFGKKFFLNRAL